MRSTGRRSQVTRHTSSRSRTTTAEQWSGTAGAGPRTASAWRRHCDTGQQPLARRAPFPTPTPDALREAFRWSELRKVAKPATVSLQSNTYNVDASLVGRQVELVFDPFDPTDIDVRFGGRSFGKAIPYLITRHAHAKAKPETPVAAPTAPTGIGYLRLIDTERTKELGQRINYEVFLPGQAQSAKAVDLGAESS